MCKLLPARIAGPTARHARHARPTAAMAVILAATAASVIAIEATPARAAVARVGTNDPVWIKSMTGGQDYGFHILWSDGTQTWTPTRSESIAECSEYDTRVERVACRATTRTEYRWMGLTKRSLRHAG